MHWHVQPTTCGLLAALLVAASTGAARAAAPSGDVLSPERRKQVDDAIDRALVMIARTQQRDGSFPTDRTGQPGVTSLCVLAFLARGHLPGAGPYGRQIDAALDYIVTCQARDGLLSARHARSGYADRQASLAAIYNHTIACLTLSEVYGMTGPERSRDIRPVIERALRYTCEQQKSRKRRRVDEGGWRYIVPPARSLPPNDSDLSVTSWVLLSLRSAKNAGFGVRTEVIDNGFGYVQRCFEVREGTFVYALAGMERTPNRGMAGAGILAYSLAGMHDTEIARTAGEWLLAHPFDRYNAQVGSDEDRFHYGAFYCSHAMFQLGGKYWRGFYPILARTLLANQRRDGSWSGEVGRDARYGNVYTTALVVLALTPQHQLLPVFQR